MARHRENVPRESGSEGGLMEKGSRATADTARLGSLVHKPQACGHGVVPWGRSLSLVEKIYGDFLPVSSEHVSE